MTSETHKSATLPVGALAGLTAAVTAFALAQGLSYPLFTFLMQRQSMTPAEIGLSAAMTPLGLILSAIFVPELVRRLGGRRLAVIAALCGALLFLLVGALQNWVAWYLLRFLIGLAINPLYILGEDWMMALAPDARRSPPRRHGRSRFLICSSLFQLKKARRERACCLGFGFGGWAPFGRSGGHLPLIEWQAPHLSADW